MSTIYIGSARHDENGNYVNGVAGDQLQTSSVNDTIGEVSMQEMYLHDKGWYILRAKSVNHADALAERMEIACNNENIGYDQNQRNTIITYGVETTTKCECDCSSLVWAVVKEATNTDPGNFTTANEVTTLTNTGLFENKGAYSSQSATPVYNGDILVTQTKGHTAIVVSGNPRTDSSTQLSTTFTASSKITLSNTSLYASSSASAASGKKTGTYYIWSNEIKNNRIRITNKSSNVGVANQVTGWIKTADAAVLNTESGSSTASSGAPAYKVGNIYTTQVNQLRVRTAAGTNSAIVSYSNLTANAKQNAYANGTLKKGTQVTCKDTQILDGDTWMKIPSGWIAAYYQKKEYVK